MKKFLWVVLAAVMVFALAACNQAPGGATAGSSPGASPGASAPAQPGSSAQNTGKKVSIMTPYLSSVTTSQMCKSLQSGLEAKGVQVTVVDTKNDFAQLASRIEDVVSTGTDAIVIVSVDPTQIQAALQTAFDAKIPVFGCDSGFIDGMQLNATSDNYAMGEQITKYLFDDLMGGKGTVIALTYRPHPGVVKRSEAFDALRPNYPNISLITEQQVEVPGPIDSARSIVDNLLLANSAKDSVTAIWCAWDEPAIGSTQSLQDAGRSEVMVTGVDGNQQALDLIKQDSNLKATIAQNFDGMSTIVVDGIANLFDGKDVQSGDVYAPGNLVTKDTLAK